MERERGDVMLFSHSPAQNGPFHYSTPSFALEVYISLVSLPVC